MKAIRGGHNFSVPGARALIDETTEDRKVYAAVIKYLQIAGESTLDVTSSIADVNAELVEGVTKANKSGADLFASIHFNKAYNSYNGAIGSEVWLNPNNAQAVAIGKRILANLEALGFENRGVKDGVNGEHLYEVRNTNMTGMIIEVCFVEATEDVAIYNKYGPDRIGLAIAEGILGRKINESVPTPETIQPQYPTYEETAPTGDNIWQVPGMPFYIEKRTDGDMSIHLDRGNYITLRKGGAPEVYWNNNKGAGGSKRLF
jgi:N-acetylmuramoyl-L-alanine amidase